MDIQSAIEYALSGEATLFLGAGFSMGASSIEGKTFATAGTLSKEICHYLGEKETTNLAISSRKLLKKEGTGGLIAYLEKYLLCSEVTEHHKEICDLAWRRIYTTNFDDVAEFASNSSGYKRVSIVATENRYSKEHHREGAIIHINGYLKKVKEENFLQEFKITNNAYLKNGFFETNWKTLFESDLRLSKAVIFIGYSLNYDVDLQKVIYNKEIRDKCLFIDHISIDEDTKFAIEEDFGTLETIGTDGFGKRVKEIKLCQQPRCNVQSPKGLKKYNVAEMLDASVTNLDVIKLLDKGDLKRPLMVQDKQYCIERNDTFKTMATKLSTAQVLLLHAHLGNGKTVALEYIMAQISLKYDYENYILEHSDTLVDDLEIILSKSKKDKVIYIDDLDMHLHKLKNVLVDLPSNVKIIATTRTVMYDRICHTLTDSFIKEEHLFTLNINSIEKNEVYSLVKLMNFHHLWGDYENLTTSQKKGRVRNKYKKQISRAVYDLFDSGVIRHKLNELFETAEISQSSREFIIASAINELCNLKLEFHELISLTDCDRVVLEDDCKNEKARELIDYQSEQFKVRSSIYADYFLNAIIDTREFSSVVMKMYVNAERFDYNERYKPFKRNIISRANLILIFSNKKGAISNSVERSIAAFYESIMNEKQVEKNPYFWFQFAITMLNLKEVSAAEIYFKNAYSNAKELDAFDTYQLDTHYSRFIFMRLLNSQFNRQSTFTELLRANDYLMKNSNRKRNLKYVINQIYHFEDFYNKFYDDLNDTEKAQFTDVIKMLPKKYNEYFKSLKRDDVLSREVVKNFKSTIRLFKSLDMGGLMGDLCDDFNHHTKKKHQVNVLSLVNVN